MTDNDDKVVLVVNTVGVYAPTPELRWLSRGSQDDAFVGVVLQQAWHNMTTGEIEWQDVPTVESE